MTPRRRRTSGSSGSSTRTDVDTPTRDRSSGGTGPGGDTDVSTDGLDTMAGRLDATGSRVDGVSSQVGGVNVGPQSMGIVGSGFTGPAQAHVQAARQQVSRTRQAVQHAQAGTRQTADGYRTTDTTSQQSFDAIDTTTDTPRTSSDTGTTTPSGSNQPPGGSNQPPPSTTDPGSTTNPPGGSNPPPTNPPPTNNDGPNNNPPPNDPPGDSGQPPNTNPPGSTTPPEHWMDTVRDNFSDKDFADFQRAMDKLSEDPTPGDRDVPGSGRLTNHERDLMARAMGLVDLDSTTNMQKVIPPDAVMGYLGGGPDADGVFPGGWDAIRGFTARHQDAGILMTPSDIIDGNRLDYNGTPYDRGMNNIHTIEYPAGDPTNYQKPVGAPGIYGELSNKNPEVQRAADAMVDAAERNGVDPNTYQRATNSWPYSGAGVTAHSTMGVPEFEISRPVPIPDGATIFEYNTAGQKTPIAVYDEDLGGWRQP